jgi:hypothetical protein
MFMIGLTCLLFSFTELDQIKTIDLAAVQFASLTISAIYEINIDSDRLGYGYVWLGYV